MCCFFLSLNPCQNNTREKVQRGGAPWAWPPGRFTAPARQLHSACLCPPPLPTPKWHRPQLQPGRQPLPALEWKSWPCWDHAGTPAKPKHLLTSSCLCPPPSWLPGQLTSQLPVFLTPLQKEQAHSYWSNKTSSASPSPKAEGIVVKFAPIALI